MEKFIALDFETATSWRGSICEVGLAYYEDGKFADKKSWLVKPPHNEYDSFNTYIHGIDSSMTAKSPTFKEIWPSIKLELDGNIIVAHNTSFDMYALKYALDEYGIEYPDFRFVCSYRLAQKLIRTYRYSLDSLCEAFDIKLSNHHRAGDDAVACAELFVKLFELSKTDSIDELVSKTNFKYGYFSKERFAPFVVAKANKLDLDKIVGDPHKIDVDSYFYGKSVCFTGKFLYGNRAELLQKIADIGGIKSNSVTKKTNILVVGQQDFRVVGDSGMSNKQRNAMKLLEDGQDIEIMSESDFYTWLDDEEVFKKVEQARDYIVLLKAIKERASSHKSRDIVFNISFDETTGKIKVELAE